MQRENIRAVKREAQATVQELTEPGTLPLNSIILGGAVGTIAFSAALRIANVLGLPQVSVSRLLGSDVLPEDQGSYALGVGWHLFNGSIVFPLLHAGFLRMTGLQPSVGSGFITGIAHGILTGIGMSTLRPVGGVFRETGPGYFGMNLGAFFPALWLGCNALYGAVVGGSYGMASAAVKRSRPLERAEEERRVA